MKMFDIVKFCQDKKCQQNIRYNRLKTGEMLSMSAAIRYSQCIRSIKPKANQEQPLPE